MNKAITLSIPEDWILKLKRKALKKLEATGKHVTISQLVMDSLQETYSFKKEGVKK